MVSLALAVTVLGLALATLPSGPDLLSVAVTFTVLVRLVPAFCTGTVNVFV